MIRIERVERLLQPWLGGALLRYTDVCVHVLQLLEDFDVMHGDYALLAEDIRELLYRTVSETTGGSMTVYRDNGRRAVIRAEDLDIMTDALLYLCFETLVHSAFHCGKLRAYALRHNSLSAIRALYVDFASFQTEEEKKMLAYTARTYHPAFRYRSWLKEEENPGE